MTIDLQIRVIRAQNFVTLRCILKVLRTKPKWFPSMV